YEPRFIVPDGRISEGAQDGKPRCAWELPVPMLVGEMRGLTGIGWGNCSGMTPHQCEHHEGSKSQYQCARMKLRYHACHAIPPSYGQWRRFGASSVVSHSALPLR